MSPADPWRSRSQPKTERPPSSADTARSRAIKASTSGPLATLSSQPCLGIESSECPEFLLASEFRTLDRRFQDPNRLIIDLERHRVGMAVLAAVREREAGGVFKAIGRSVYDFGHHRKRAHGACADPGRQQQIRIINRAKLGGGRKSAVEAAGEHVLWSHIMVRRHDEMRQFGLGRWGCVKRFEFTKYAVGSKLRKKRELSVASFVRPMVG